MGWHFLDLPSARQSPTRKSSARRRAAASGKNGGFGRCGRPPQNKISAGADWVGCDFFLRATRGMDDAARAGKTIGLNRRALLSAN
jgi:hypothetical protein